MQRRITVLAIALAALASGCASRRPIGHFGDGAFYHTRGHYRIRYGSAPTRLLPDGWRLTNYDHGDDGAPTAEHVDEVEIDASMLMGRGRAQGIRVPKIDLLYQQEDGDGEIWVRTMVLPAGWEQASAEQVLQTWASSVEQGHLTVDPLGRMPAGHATLTHWGSAVVDGEAAHWVELDVNRGGVDQRVTVVGVRPGHHHWRRGRRQRFPMLLMFGYVSSPDEHEAVRHDFEQLVRRVDIGR
ncbi:MAG: hypothetical protein H6719_04980 [Sandaracinaceae bacterium]|nr:hypothetical protein [Sandaracinaceae bacterium]